MGKHKRGFTMAELLVALMVASIVLAAAATLAGALAGGKRVTDQVGRTTVCLMQLQHRLSDLLTRAEGVCDSNAAGFCLWHDIDEDGAIDESEKTWVAAGATGDGLTIGGVEQYDFCLGVEIHYDVLPPATKLVTVRFDIYDGRLTQPYAVSGTLRGR